jgi:hypothetical protein
LALTFGILGLMLVAGACARGHLTARTQAQARDPSSFTLRPNDGGKTVNMHIGDRLVFVAGESSASPDWMAWSIVSYPQGELSLGTDPKQGPPFRFVARHAGVGKLRLSFRPACAPGPLAADGINCPLVGPGAGEAMPNDVLVRLLTITVRVYGQGAG